MQLEIKCKKDFPLQESRALEVVDTTHAIDPLECFPEAHIEHWEGVLMFPQTETNTFPMCTLVLLLIRALIFQRRP